MHLRQFFSLGIVVCAALMLSACGGKDEDTGEGENGGNGGGNGKDQSKIVGKWVIDMSAMIGPAIAMMEGQLAEASEEEKKEIEAEIAKMKEAKVEMEFTADGKMIGTRPGPNGQETENGTYQIKSSKGDTIVMVTAMGDDEPEEVSVKFVDDDTIEVTPPEGQGPKMTAKRVK